MADKVACKSDQINPWTARDMLTGISDIHIYYLQTNETQTKYAKELWERIRRECELIQHT